MATVRILIAALLLALGMGADAARAQDCPSGSASVTTGGATKHVPRSVGYSGRTRAGTQFPIGKSRTRVAKPSCTQVKPAEPVTAKPEPKPVDAVNVKTTIINGANGQVIVNQVSVPTAPAAKPEPTPDSVKRVE